MKESIEVPERLNRKISDKTAQVAVIGLGYVGLRLALEKCRAGFNVTGIDLQENKVEMLNQGNSYLRDIKDEQLLLFIQYNRFKATTSFEEIDDVDIIIICVPTPLTEMREPDLSFIENSLHEIVPRMKKGQLIVLESTTYPGTTEEFILPRLQTSGLKVGEDFFLAYSPERVDPANKVFNTRNTPKIIGGVTANCRKVACLFYEQTICKVVPVTSPAVAEMAKIFENTYRAVNIGFVNELMLLCEKMNLDIWEVIDAASTKPFGIEVFYPGPGFGGHCIPIDPFYLAYRARKYGFYVNFIELAGQLNIQASNHVIDKIKKVLNANKKCINGSNILIIGVAYKKDVEDVRESPALRIISGLLEEKGEVNFYDPFVQNVELPSGIFLESVSLDEQTIQEADCVVILTDHTCIDYEYLVEKAGVVIDTRNATKNIENNRFKIYKI